MIHLIPIVIGAGILAGIAGLARIAIKKPTTPRVPNTVSAGTKASMSNIVESLVRNNNLVEVKLGDETWLVTPNYVGPVGIGEAAQMAKDMGMELPSPALVDAIWRQADLKLLPMPRNNVISEAVFEDQRQRIQNQIGDKEFTLVGGTFKDVVMFNGVPQIYGWHVDVENGKNVPGVPLNKPFTPGPGKVIQPLSGNRHTIPGAPPAVGFKDYSQGARFVKRA